MRLRGGGETVRPSCDVLDADEDVDDAEDVDDLRMEDGLLTTGSGGATLMGSCASAGSPAR